MMALPKFIVRAYIAYILNSVTRRSAFEGRKERVLERLEAPTRCFHRAGVLRNVSRFCENPARSLPSEEIIEGGNCRRFTWQVFQTKENPSGLGRNR